MESYDPKKAAQVWKRVLAEADPLPQQPQPQQPLIALEQENAAQYLALAGRMPQKTGSRLRQLAAQNHAHIACLRGLCVLQDLQRSAVKLPQPRPMSLTGGLRLCFQREIQSYHAYTERSADPEFGPVFAQLAANKRSQCQQLLELLGTESS